MPIGFDGPAEKPGRACEPTSKDSEGEAALLS